MINSNFNFEHSPKIGEVYNVYFEGSNSVQNGWRPGVIFQNNIGNAHSPNVVVLPLTSSLKKLDMPTHVLVKANDTGLRVDSMVICENPECVSKNNLGKYITTLSESYIKEIAISSLIATSAIGFIDFDSLVNVWKKAAKINNVDCFGGGLQCITRT